MKRYYLVADPCTGLIVRRSHYSALSPERHFITLEVLKKHWRRCKAGEPVTLDLLNEPDLSRWMRYRETYGEQGR